MHQPRAPGLLHPFAGHCAPYCLVLVIRNNKVSLKNVTARAPCRCTHYPPLTRRCCSPSVARLPLSPPGLCPQAACALLRSQGLRVIPTMAVRDDQAKRVSGSLGTKAGVRCVRLCDADCSDRLRGKRCYLAPRQHAAGDFRPARAALRPRIQ